jgi:hypothetical protein
MLKICTVEMGTCSPNSGCVEATDSDGGSASGATIGAIKGIACDGEIGWFVSFKDLVRAHLPNIQLMS